MPISADILDALGALLEAELGSVFRFLGQGGCYLSRASADIRQPLAKMIQTPDVHARALHELIESEGGYPTRRRLRPDEQYLAFLSMNFLLPKLIDATKLLIERYENALAVLRNTPPSVIPLLQSHLSDYREQLATLEKASRK